MSFFKDLPMRDDAWLDWVRSQPSCISGGFTRWNDSGDGRNVAHHVVGGRCSTSKTSDYLAIPLTDTEHKWLHQFGWRAWESEHGDQRRHSANMLLAALQSGAWKLEKCVLRRIA